MRLLDLGACFIRWGLLTLNGVGFYKTEAIDKAQGVMFLCPKCFIANGGQVSTHMVVCWSRNRGAPDDATPLPGRWRIEGAGLHDLTLDAEPPEHRRSIQVGSPCNAHFNVTGGEATMC